METPAAVPVKVRTQGGKWREGFALGHMGSQLFIRYQIGNGDLRERWFVRDRWSSHLDLDEIVEKLPRYGKRKCPARTLPISEGYKNYSEMCKALAPCKKCKLNHRVVYEYIGGGDSHPYLAKSVQEIKHAIVNLETWK